MTMTPNIQLNQIQDVGRHLYIYIIMLMLINANMYEQSTLN